jgi:Uma2 family endonuclease
MIGSSACWHTEPCQRREERGVSEAPVLAEHHGPYTIEDLEAMPDDGQRYELIDGALHVSPSPASLHQRVTKRLCTLLDAASPVELEALPAAVDVQTGKHSVLEPDVVVLRSAVVESLYRVIDSRDVALVAEVVSPSSVWMDRLVKPRLYASGGIPAYLLVETDEPRVSWFGLSASGGYELRGVASGDEVLRVTEPFDVSIVPADLVRAKG